MKIYAIIPSRYGSTRFEGKPLALIAGRPMIEWVVERVRRCRRVADVAVATDDERIFQAVRRFGGRAVMTGQAHPSGTDRVAAAAEEMELDSEDIVINVQGDQPLIDPRSLDEVIEPLIADADLEMSTLAYAIVKSSEITNPKDVKVTFDRRGNALYFSRSAIPFGRDPHTVFDTYKHLGVYAYRRRFLEVFRSLPEGRLEAIEKLEQLRALENGYAIRVVVSGYDSPEVDLPGDIQMIEGCIGDGSPGTGDH